MRFFNYIAYFMRWIVISFAQNFKIHFSKFLYQILLRYFENDAIIYKVKIHHMQ